MLPVLSVTLFVYGCGCHCIRMDWREVWNQTGTIAVICVMLMERAMNSALHWDKQR